MDDAFIQETLGMTKMSVSGSANNIVIDARVPPIINCYRIIDSICAPSIDSVTHAHCHSAHCQP